LEAARRVVDMQAAELAASKAVELVVSKAVEMVVLKADTKVVVELVALKAHMKVVETVAPQVVAKMVEMVATPGNLEGPRSEPQAGAAPHPPGDLLGDAYLGAHQEYSKSVVNSKSSNTSLHLRED